MIQYNNFLMKREQSRAGSRFAECEKSRLKAKLIMTLVALFAMSAGAWAQETSWTNIVSNSDMEGTDVSCFYVKENAKGAGNMYIARITEGIGVENSRAIKVLSDGKEVETWDTQFFIRLPYELPAGTKYKLTFDYKADKDARADFQCANEPGEYINWYIGENDTEDFSFTTSWQTFSKEFTVPEACDGKKHSENEDWLNNFQTIYFSLAMDAPNGTPAEFIIDNVKVEIPTEVLNNLTPKPVTDPSLMLTYVTKDATNQWSFTMPGYDMELTPEYAPVAAWAEVESVKQLPAAAEGVIAGTDDPLIVEGIVAFAGTSTEVRQGTVMYAVTPTSVTDASELTASDWKNTVPTAKNIADNGAEVKVWYYIQGADTPDGETPTADNTFNDSEICTTPLTVTVRSNKFDLTLKAANTNTIDATQTSKGTVSVKVGTGTAVDKTEDIAEGKLKAIKMGSEVKLEAKPGYKFRKVEVKKAASTPTLKDALADGATVVITYTWDDTNVTMFTYTNNGGNYTGNTTGDDAEYFDNEMSMGGTTGGTTLQFTASNRDISDANVSIDFFTDTNEYVAVKGRYFTSFTISVNGTDITSQLTEVK